MGRKCSHGTNASFVYHITKSKGDETKNRTGVRNSLNISKLKENALDYLWTADKKDGSCICSGWQIEHYMKNRYIVSDKKTHLWQFFDIIVVDEVHSLATDATYADAPFYLLDFIRGAYQDSNLPIVLMTATHAPIDGLLRVEKKKDYRYWDFTKECRNLLPKQLWYQTTEQTLREMVRYYNIRSRNKSKWVYFATKINTISNFIVPYLINSGIPEKEIAVSFTNEEDAEKFSDVILENKVRVEESLKTNEDIPDDVKIFITTSRNKEGIKCQYKSGRFFQGKKWSKIKKSRECTRENF